MKKLFIFSLLILVNFNNASIIPASASSLNCTKVGQVKVIKKMQYICKKSKGKLVYTLLSSPSNRVVKAGDVSNSIPAINPSVYDDELSGKSFKDDDLRNKSDIINKSLDFHSRFEGELTIFQNQFLDGFYPVDKSYFIVDPDLDKDFVDNLKTDIGKVNHYFYKNFPSVSISPRVYIYNTKNFNKLYHLLLNDLTQEALEGGWLEQKLANASRDPDNLYGGGSAGYGKDGVPVLFYYFNKVDLHRPDVKHIFSHEIIHAYQRALLGNMSKMTCWIREGQAVYLGYMFSSNSVTQIRDGWKTQFEFISHDPFFSKYLSFTLSDWENWLIDQETKSVLECDNYSNYIFGSMVWSYLYYKYGHELTSKFFTSINYEISESNHLIPGDAWVKAFKNTLSVSPKEEYVNISNYILWFFSIAKENNWYK